MGVRFFPTFNTVRAAIDWVTLSVAVVLVGAGLVTMYSFTGESSVFFRQVMWLCISVCVYVLLAQVDYRSFRKTWVLVSLYSAVVVLLLAVSVIGVTVKGAQSWFSFGGFSFQPSDIAKIVLILVLAKYFSRRHVEIGHWGHILTSSIYAGILFFLILLQPDFGSAIIIGSVWLGMVLLSGMNKRHLFFVIATGIGAFIFLWTSVFAPYQKQRIITFISPLTDIQGAGYNAYQSTIAVGSGQVFGKGVGFGTQSRLQFLPEYQTDFIFASFAEEWGFVGIILLFTLYGVLFWRILRAGYYGASNFETLYAAGFAILLLSQFTVHVGMNIGLLPVTGLTIPFMSYGGSHLLTEFAGLGILSGMGKYRRVIHREEVRNEFIGPT